MKKFFNKIFNSWWFTIFSKFWILYGYGVFMGLFAHCLFGVNVHNFAIFVPLCLAWLPFEECKFFLDIHESKQKWKEEKIKKEEEK